MEQASFQNCCQSKCLTQVKRALFKKCDVSCREKPLLKMKPLRAQLQEGMELVSFDHTHTVKIKRPLQNDWSL